MASNISRTRKVWYNDLFAPLAPFDPMLQGAQDRGWEGLGDAAYRSLLLGNTFNKETDQTMSYLSNSLAGDSKTFWDSLTDVQRKNILDDYFETSNSFGNLWGITGDYEILDEDTLLRDLEELSRMRAEYAALGDAPIYSDFLDSAREQVARENDEMYADLDKLLDTRTRMYNDELANLAESYNTSRSNLLSQQYQQNSQLMGTLQSGMERSRRNALEAGASAGMRIADNINTLLSVQNKQSATAMETANQLSQMMINQRNAESSVRNSYADALTKDTYDRHSIKLNSESRATSLADTNYNAANDRYSSDLSKLDSKYSMDNKLYGYRNYTPRNSSGGY